MTKKISNVSKIYNIMSSNPLLKVFTREYREETRHIEFMESNINRFKLKSRDESIDEKISALQNIGYESDFRITPLYDRTENKEKVKIKSTHL